MKESELGRTYSHLEIIFKEGEIGEAMYIIQSGKVKITKKTPSGEATLATLQSGDILGEMALFDRLPRSATAKALGEARVLTVDSKKLFTMIDRDPTLVLKILESMSKRIRMLNEELTKLKKAEATMFNMCFNVDEACDMILEQVKKIFKADNGSVMLLDDKREKLLIRTAFGAESDKKVEFKAGVGIAGDVMRTGKAELINNAAMDPRFVGGAVQISSLLCVPLTCNNNILGVINISSASKKLFTLDDLRVLSSLSAYAACALQNTLNFCGLKDLTDEILDNATMLNSW